MTMVTRSLLILSLLFAGRAAPACAQDEPARSGFWFGLGLGYGAASFTCNGCSGGPRLGGWALSFALGATPNPHVRVAAGGSGWLHGWKGDRLPAIDAWALSLWYYPQLRGGPFVEGGVGPAHYMLAKGTGDPLESISSSPSPAAGTGWGFTLGVGWEGKVVPRVTYAYGNVGTLHAADGSTVATGWKQHLLIAEVGFRLQPWH